MFDSNRPTAADMRAMRADADRVRAQHQTAPVADTCAADCDFCAIAQPLMARAS